MPKSHAMTDVAPEPANRLLASASLDRLRHNAYCLVLDGQSYRAPKQLSSPSRQGPAKASK